MQIRNISAFPEARLDLQFNSAKNKKQDGMGYWAEAACHQVTGFLSSSDCSKGQSWFSGRVRSIKCIRCHSGEGGAS